MNCLIIDDEPLAVKLLSDYVQKTEGLALLNAFTNPIVALQSLNENPPDLVFLDIQMPELTGVQFLKITNRKYPVILTTAYEQYALEGYEHDVIDYLLKPISYERFLVAISKARERIKPTESVAEIVVKPTIVTDYIFVKSEYKIQKIDFADILYLEGLGDYVAIHLASEKILTLENMKDLAAQLPDDRFVRVHRSYIVSLKKINFIERHRIVINDKYIPISNSYKEAFYAQIRKQ